MKKITALFLSLSLLVCSFLFASAAENNNEGANVTEPASEVFIDNIDNSYEDLELESGIDSSAKEEIREAIETFSEENDIKTETTTVGVTTEARETAEIQEVTTIQEAAEPASDLEGVSSQEITETQETDANQETTESQEEDGDSPIPPSTPLSDEKEVMPIQQQETFDITISWVGLVFTYEEPNKGKWNPYPDNPEKKPGYEGGKDKGTWTSNDGNKTYGTITVSNNSSKYSGVKVTFGFTKNPAFNSYTLIMKFYDNVNGDGSFGDEYKEDIKEITVPKPSGESGSVERNIYVVPGKGKDVGADVFNSADGNLGTITVTINTLSNDDIEDPPIEGPDMGEYAQLE